MVQKLIETIKKKVGKSTVQVKPFQVSERECVRGWKGRYRTDINDNTFQVKNHMWVFVNSLIENPTFDSQTKETMTLQSKSFGSKCEVSDKFAKQVYFFTSLVLWIIVNDVFSSKCTH